MSDAAKGNKLFWKKHKKGNKSVRRKKNKTKQKQKPKNRNRNREQWLSDQNKDTTRKVSTRMFTKAEPPEDF